ncbi:hypothetical protein [Ulvibacter litoralis]|uniref:hypothetical protein n=1 Tax=Ulvibacter litoralis TaxID=227084 RepID=UPI001113172F|nr:hypothetical protein [Ulvibacter litoralis]
MIQKEYKRVLAIVALILLAFSIGVHHEENYFLYRMLRAVCCFVFLGFLLYFKKRKENPLLVLFLLFYGLSSFIVVWYEKNTLAIISLIFNLIAVLILIRAIFPKVSFKKMNSYFISLLTVLVLFNGYLLYEFVYMTKDYTFSSAHYALILVGSMSLLVLCFLALLYNFLHSTKASLIFALFVFAILFAEIFRAIGYYDFAYGNAAVYISRFLLLTSLYLLVNYCMIEKVESEKLSQRIF